MLHLIAHKVRGEAAFDVALRADDMGTDSDPGPWWIIPTTGRRAWPFWFTELDSLLNSFIGFHDRSILESMPEGLPDHYPPQFEPRKRARDLTELDLVNLEIEL